MQRKITNTLKKWKEEKHPYPLLLRGARQVGKTYIVKQFAKDQFEDFLYINFEEEPEWKEYFKIPKAKSIVNKIFLAKKSEIITGKTLLFLDEIQECPEAILAMRYFYEDMPGLHVIGAGSLLEFTLREGHVSIPVGRIQFLFLEALSFEEFLLANDYHALIKYIGKLGLCDIVDESIHNKLLNELKIYMIIGGMPKAVDEYIQDEDFAAAFKVQNLIAMTYKEDFGKYSRFAQHKYLEKTFNALPRLIGKKYKYSHVDSSMRSNDLKNAFELLLKANIVKKIKQSSPLSHPLEALASDKHFKALFIDLGIMQKILGLSFDNIFDEKFHSSAAGGIAEQFVGQELLALTNPYEERGLYFWQKDKRNDSAEVDYLIKVKNHTLAVEVKAGSTGSLKSLRSFINQFDSPFGIRISQHPLSFHDGVLSIPFYACSQIYRLAEEALDSL